MRALVAAFLVGLLLAPPTAALHDSEQIEPAVEPTHTFREAIYDLNRTIREVEERHGESPEIDQAKNKRALAAQAYVAGNHWLTLAHLLEATSLVERVDTWEENEGASDREAAYYEDMEDKWSEANAVIHDTRDRFEELQSEGVDLYMLDHALLAGAILTKGERRHAAWSQYSQAWEKGQRNDQLKNGLASTAHGAILHAEIAKGLLDRAERNQTDEPVGPVVGNSTLRGITESLEPNLANGSVSIDTEFNQIIGSQMANEQWLSALGATVAWSEKQAPAAVQHVMQEDEEKQVFKPDDVVDYFFQLEGEDDTLAGVDDLGVPGATARYSLSEARGTAQVLEERVRQNDTREPDWQVAIQAGQGLGALSAAHTSLAILKVAAGETPPDRIVHLPTHSPGAVDLGNGTAGEPADEDSRFGVPGPGLALAGVAVGLAALVRRRR